MITKSYLLMKKASVIFVFTIIIFLLYGCKCQNTGLPATLGEIYSSYTYIPFDPLAVSTTPGDSCNNCRICTSCDSISSYKSLLESFPDQTVRLSIEKFELDGSISYGNFVTAKAKNETYRVTLDYINADVSQVPFLIKCEKVDVPIKEKGFLGLSCVTNIKTARKCEIKPDVRFKYRKKDDSLYKDTGSVLKKQRSVLNDAMNPEIKDVGWEQYTVPVYIGVGLRIVAKVTTLDSDVSLSGLGAIAGEVKAGRLEGNLTVQTLGITGKSVAAALPLPGEINETTIQNAIMSIGSIKAQLYAENETSKDIIISPRVVGIYKPFLGGEEVVNQIISELSRERVKWHRPCKPNCGENKETKQQNRLNE